MPMPEKVVRLILAFSLLVVSGCATTGNKKEAEKARIRRELELALSETKDTGRTSELPENIAVIPLEGQEPDYHLQPEDILSITVYEQPDLTTRARITSEGKISLPLLGKIQAAGLTVSELKDKIEDLLEKDYLVSPQVHVFIDKYHVKQISVLGAVKNPGKYDMYTERETTLLESIAMAGGFSDVAAVNGTRIIRSDKDGEKRIIQIRVTDITKKGEKKKDVALKPGDIVFVPESFF